MGDQARLQHDLKMVNGLLEQYGYEHPFPSPLPPAATPTQLSEAAKAVHIVLQLLSHRIVPFHDVTLR